MALASRSKPPTVSKNMKATLMAVSDISPKPGLTRSLSSLLRSERRCAPYPTATLPATQPGVTLKAQKQKQIKT